MPKHPQNKTGEDLTWAEKFLLRLSQKNKGKPQHKNMIF